MKTLVCLSIMILIFADPQILQEFRKKLELRNVTQLRSDVFNVALHINGSTKSLKYLRNKEDLIDYLMIAAKNPGVIENYDKIVGDEIRTDKPVSSIFLESNDIEEYLTDKDKEDLIKIALIIEKYEQVKANEDDVGGLIHNVEKLTEEELRQEIKKFVAEDKDLTVTKIEELVRVWEADNSRKDLDFLHHASEEKLKVYAKILEKTWKTRNGIEIKPGEDTDFTDWSTHELFNYVTKILHMYKDITQEFLDRSTQKVGTSLSDTFSQRFKFLEEKLDREELNTLAYGAEVAYRKENNIPIDIRGGLVNFLHSLSDDEVKDYIRKTMLRNNYLTQEKLIELLEEKHHLIQKKILAKDEAYASFRNLFEEKKEKLIKALSKLDEEKLTTCGMAIAVYEREYLNGIINTNDIDKMKRNRIIEYVSYVFEKDEAAARFVIDFCVPELEY
jgi:hypothetical protein